MFVLEWLDGRTMSNEALGAPGHAGADRRGPAPAPRRPAVPRRLRHVPHWPSGTSRVVDERDIPIPAGYREHLAALPRIEAALAVHPLPTVPCHNDLLADNYLDDGERLWLVDWEYSGNNDPTFELGNTCQELGYDDDAGRASCAPPTSARPPLPCSPGCASR